MNIALVGNGPSATNKVIGPIIDSFDMVVRFNNFIQNGYEPFVGKRTDVHAVNEGLYYGGIQDRGLPVLMAVPWTKPTRPCVWQVMDYLMPSDWALISEEAARSYSNCKEHWPSTGLLTITHFLLSGHKLWLSGFDCFQSDRHHYGDDASFCGSHIPDLEARTLQDLAEEGLVYFL